MPQNGTATLDDIQDQPARGTATLDDIATEAPQAPASPSFLSRVGHLATGLVPEELANAFRPDSTPEQAPKVQPPRQRIRPGDVAAGALNLFSAGPGRRPSGAYAVTTFVEALRRTRTPGQRLCVAFHAAEGVTG